MIFCSLYASSRSNSQLELFETSGSRLAPRHRLSSPLAPSKLRSAPHCLPSPILATATCRLFEFYSFLSRTFSRLSPRLPHNRLTSTHSVVSPDVFLPSLRTRRRITSLRLTLKLSLSLSLTMAPGSFRHAPLAGRSPTPLASSCSHLSHPLALSHFLSISFLLSLQRLPPVQILGTETRVSVSLPSLSSVFFSHACLLLGPLSYPT